jgi:hypothetical protein
LFVVPIEVGRENPESVVMGRRLLDGGRGKVMNAQEWALRFWSMNYRQ